MKLTGKVALITNVSQFMGPAITEEFCREGAALALHDRDESALLPLCRLVEKLGREVFALSGDLTRSADADRVVTAVVERFGRLDILVNNNAHPPTGSPTEQVSDAVWREMTARLLDEPFFCLRAALRVMRPAGRGKIINMSSAAAFPGLANYAAYTAARAGVNGLTKAVGREVAKDGIQVNAIAQNYVENPTYFPPALTADPKTLARMVKHIPAGRLARGEESARLAVYLASEESDFFVGQVIPFAGGWVTRDRGVMTASDRLLIAIPTYNERENIEDLLPTLLADYPEADIVVIDDNSPDGTGAVVAALAAGDRRVHLIRRDRKRGLGSAYRAAFAWALERDYARVLVMDADRSHDPAEIEHLLAAADRADVVVGSRYVTGGRVVNWPLSRLALSTAANALARVMVGGQVRDWTAGFKCYGRPALASLDLASIRSEGYSFQVEILFQCHRAGWKIAEVPISFTDRRRGHTKMSRREVYQAMATLSRIAWRRAWG